MKIEHLVKDRVNGCPFGHKCDDCNLYRPVYNTGIDGSVTAKYDCNINHAVLISDELKRGVMRVQKATESFRNQVMGAQEQIPHEQREALPPGDDDGRSSS